jgi:hypothetical protein
MFLAEPWNSHYASILQITGRFFCSHLPAAEPVAYGTEIKSASSLARQLMYQLRSPRQTDVSQAAAADLEAAPITSF